MQTKNLCVLIHYIINDEVGTVKLVVSFVDLFRCLLFLFVFANTRCMFVATLWSPLAEELTSLFSRLNVMLSCVFVTFLFGPGSGVVLDCIDS